MWKKTKTRLSCVFAFAAMVMLICAVNAYSVFAETFASNEKVTVGEEKTVSLNSSNKAPVGISYQVSKMDSNAYYLNSKNDYINFTADVDCEVTINTYKSSGCSVTIGDKTIQCGESDTITAEANKTYTIKTENVGYSNGVTSLIFTPITVTSSVTTTTETTTETTTTTTTTETTTETTTIAFKTIFNANEFETTTFTSKKLIASDKFMVMPAPASATDTYVSVLSSIRNNVNVGGRTISFTKALNTNGAGDESKRSVMFRTASGTQNAKLYVYATSGNDTNNVLKLVSNNGYVSATIDPTAVNEAVFDIKPGTTYYLAGSGSINLYYVGATAELETLVDYDSMITGYVNVGRYQLSYNNGAVLSNTSGMIASAKNGASGTDATDYITLDTTGDTYVAFKLQAGTSFPCRFNVADATIQITALGTGTIDEGKRVIEINSANKDKTVMVEAGSEDSVFVLRFTDTTKQSPARVKNITFFTASATTTVDIIKAEDGAIVVGRFNGDPSVYSNVGFCISQNVDNVVSVNNSAETVKNLYVSADVLANKVYVGEDIKYSNEGETDCYYYAVYIKGMSNSDTFYACGYTEVNGVKCKETLSANDVKKFTMES